MHKKYKNFTDLGNYVIDCDRHRHFDLERAIKYVNDHSLNLTSAIPMSCSALATRTDKGDVLIGRNLDLTISQYPCYITHVRGPKYDTLNFTYDEGSSDKISYDELLCRGAIDNEYFNALPMLASDSMNSEGLYIEYNMRDYEKQFICLGTNPRAQTRICSISIPFLVSANCATIEEALHYLRHKLNIYTVINETFASGWNLCCMIGDATGAYGLIEIANDEIKFLPKQHGQGNYYIFPEYNCTSRGQSGYGRLQFGLERIDQVQSELQMAHLMEDIMWKNEILHIPYAYRDNYDHIHFCNERYEPSLDWRSDNVHLLPINKFGKYIDIDDCTPEARKVREYKRCYDLYIRGIDVERNYHGYEKYMKYLNRCDLDWVYDNDNFETLQRGLIKYYIDSGIVDKLQRYYAGDEKPLRDDGNIWTTSLSFSVNCTKKRLHVKFWENPRKILYFEL